MKSLKPPKGAKAKPTHTSRAKIGQGDFYGSGVPQKFGRTVDSYVEPFAKNKKKGKPPKKLA